MEKTAFAESVPDGLAQDELAQDELAQDELAQGELAQGELAQGNAQVGDPLGDKARELFGLPYLFPYQRLVISNIMEAAQRERSSGDPDGDRAAMGSQIVILPTGAGKSLCFQLPAMLLSGPTLVLYPILSLMAETCWCQSLYFSFGHFFDDTVGSELVHIRVSWYLR